MHRRGRGYSLLMVLMLMGLLGVAVGGLFAVILRGAQSSGAMLDRRTTFYACDGMGRQLASLGQAFLSRNTVEDVPEHKMERELRASLPLITPAGFTADPRELVIPERALPEPAPIEVITTGPFSGLEVKLQVIDMRFSAKRDGSGAVCRTEQTLSLGRIALFQFFVFADLPLLDIVPPGDDAMLLRGRIHTNGRMCLGGANTVDRTTGVRGPFAVRFDANITAVDRILRSSDGKCSLPGQDVGIIGNQARGPAPAPPEPDRLLEARLFEPFTERTQSGCTRIGTDCEGGWRAYALSTLLGRMQDKDHEVQELTLPVDPPEMRSQRGWAARGATFEQRMHAGPSRPNTRFLVEPALTNDPTGFARNKMSFKAQIRIIDGVWYVKDPGPNNDVAVDDDDGPWPGIPIWSDHPGEFTAATPAMGKEGTEGVNPIEVGQSDIRAQLDLATDGRLAKSKWSLRASLGAPPTPRRFSYYAFVDRTQADSSTATLNPPGMGLQFGRVRRSSSSSNDTDPPAVISYGGLSPVFLPSSSSSSSFGSGAFNDALESSPPTSGEQSYWVPGVRMTDERIIAAHRTSYARRPTAVGFCGGRSEQIGTGNEVSHNVMLPAVPQPLTRVSDDDDNAYFPTGFPAPGSPLPSDGTVLEYADGDSSGWGGGRLCQADNDGEFRKRMRLALLESTRTGFSDTNNHGGETRMNGAPPDVLPLNFNLHAFQEALADKTPGELGSYFCAGCMWEKFDGTVFVTNTWKGSMLGADTFPNGLASPPPDPNLDDRASFPDGDLVAQPRAPHEALSTTGPLPFQLCGAPSDETGTAHAQVVGQRFLEADEVDVRPGRGTLNIDPRAPFRANEDFGPSINQRDTFQRKMRKPTLPPGSPPERTPTVLALPDDLASAGTTITGSFRIPECANYAHVGGKWTTVRATSVRVINGRTLNFNASKCGTRRNQACQPRLSPTAAGLIENGLNVVTNVPVYIVGDINQSSEVDEVTTGEKAEDWIPFMVGGDSVTTLSNAWDDEHSRWNVATNSLEMNVNAPFVPRVAQSTRYHMLLLTGIVGAGVYGGGNAISPIGESGGGLPGAMRLMENWSDAEHVFRGAIVLGWMPVFTQWSVARPAVRSYRPPAIRNWQFDRHLNATVNQPPDSPVFDVTALRSWRRE